MTAVRLGGVSKSYGTTSVLRELELDVPQGCFAAVLGPSGCGKTTLLRLIAGFERADSGRILLGDRVLDDGRSQVPAERRGIGYVPQEGLLFPHLDVARNVAFGLPLRERRRSRERVAELLELVGLSGLERRRPDELSGGQQQRVALARALAPRPEVLLLDEPFAALDAGLREGLRQDVKAILAAVGATVILVTHDQEEALSLAEVVAVLRDGRIVQAASPQDVYSRPATADVARFVGDANLVPAVSAGATAVSPLGTLALANGGAPSGTQILVLIRPEQIELVDPADAPPGAPEATVCDTTYYGHDAVVTLQPAGAGGPERLVARTDRRPRAAAAAARRAGLPRRDGGGRDPAALTYAIQRNPLDAGLGASGLAGRRPGGSSSL